MEPVLSRDAATWLTVGWSVGGGLSLSLLLGAGEVVHPQAERRETWDLARGEIEAEETRVSYVDPDVPTDPSPDWEAARRSLPEVGWPGQREDERDTWTVLGFGVGSEAPRGFAWRHADAGRALATAVHSGGRWRPGPELPAETALATWDDRSVLVWDDGAVLVHERHGGDGRRLWLLPADNGDRWREARVRDELSGRLDWFAAGSGRALAVGSGALAVYETPTGNWRILARKGLGSPPTRVTIDGDRAVIEEMAWLGDEVRFSAGLVGAGAGIALLVLASVLFVRRRFTFPPRVVSARPPVDAAAADALPRDAGVDFAIALGIFSLFGFGALSVLAAGSSRDFGGVVVGLGLVSIGGGVALLAWRLRRGARPVSAVGLTFGSILGLVLGAFTAFVLLLATGIIRFGSGRPLRSRGRVVLPRVRRARRPVAGGQSSSLVGRWGWSRTVARVAHRHWVESARHEASSVPTFERLAGELARVGAPGALVERAIEAAADERRHAQMCLSLAERFGPRVELEPLPVGYGAPRELEEGELLVALAVESLVEGALGEGLAVAAMVRSSMRAAPEVRGAMAAIIEDERRHAELAWEVVAFALERGGEHVREAVVAALGRLGDDRGARGIRARERTSAFEAAGCFVESAPGETFAAVLEAVRLRAERMLAG